SGQSHEYYFALEDGQYARLEAEQRTINVALAFFSPTGAQLFQVDNYAGGETEQAELIASGSGMYRLRVAASERQAPAGRYEISLRAVSAPTQTHRLRIAAAREFALAMS